MPEIPNLICIVGQTASGKSDLAIRIALKWDGELICADSNTVRRELNIGTAKPSLADRKLVPHHMIDIIRPNDTFNAAEFKRLANEKIEEIYSRGKLPILVGGTGLYIDSVIYDYGFLSKGTRALRDELNDLSTNELLMRIKAIGLKTNEIDSNNRHRLIRYIETKGQKPEKKSLRKNTLLLGIKIDKKELSTRITNRVDMMLENGLEHEVELLVKKYGWDCEGLKGIGYSQWKEYFLGNENSETVRQNIIVATTKLAKRQMTWFRRNKSIHWMDNTLKWNNVAELITTFLNTDVPN
ncbi:MAG: tRNA (adenosine(37)-N6)-dimethylallyltransferase MiaA [Candidatus Saccharimonadales bacterium]